LADRRSIDLRIIGSSLEPDGLRYALSCARLAPSLLLVIDTDEHGVSMVWIGNSCARHAVAPHELYGRRGSACRIGDQASVGWILG